MTLLFAAAMNILTSTLSRRISGPVTSKHPRGSHRFSLLLMFFFASLPATLYANTYPLPVDGDFLIGEIYTVRSSEEDTLLDIARQFDLGYNEITAANPGVDPWLPGEGTEILVPTQFILPEPPWEGMIINLAEMRLYYFPVPNDGEIPVVITHPIGIGRQGWSTPEGLYSIIMKIEKPSWTMPESVYQEHLAEGQNPPRVVPPGPDNPLGDFAMKISNDGLYIHGTNKPYGIGMRVSHGCLRLYPEDIKTLVRQIPNNTQVRIVQQPYKFGHSRGRLFMEAHQPIDIGSKGADGYSLTPIISGVVKASKEKLSNSEWEYLLARAENPTGIPVPVRDVTTVSLPAPW